MNIIYKAVVLFSLVLMYCGYEFPTSYNRVENDRVRPLAIVFDNDGLAEAAPGEIVTVRAYFAGQATTSYEWSLSSMVLSGGFGMSAVADTIALSEYVVPGTYKEFKGGGTDSVEFKIIIPDSIIRDRFDGTMTIGEVLSSQVPDSVSESFLELQVGVVLSALELLAAYSPGPANVTTDAVISEMVGDSINDIKDNLPLLLQLFSVAMKLNCVVNGAYNTEASFTVRYNSNLVYLGGFIPVNRNPVLNGVKLYKVRGNVSSFNQYTDISRADGVQNLNGGDSIHFETGFSYFLVANRDYNIVDTAVSMSGWRDLESTIFDWFYRNDDSIPGVSKESLFMLKSRPGSSVVKVYPSQISKMHHVSLWVVLYDAFIGERIRPVGFAFKAYNGVVVK